MNTETEQQSIVDREAHSLPLDRFAQELGLGLGSFGDYETVAGLVLDRMGAIPRAGEKCRGYGCVFEVLDMDGNRIDKILVTREAEPEDPLKASGTNDARRRQG